jgi:membrane associated rhomboid family serine protease
MIFGPVGIRCPEHAGQAQQPRVTAGVRRAARREMPAAPVSKALIVVNVGIYLAQLALGAPLNGNSGVIFEDGVLYGPLVADGDWWRLVTAAFLHYGPLHLGMNMLVLWWFGPPLEDALGSARFLLLYLVGGLAGSAGALIWTPDAATVGASGAIFAMFGAALVLERQGVPVFGAALTLIAINLVITFTLSGVSIGGHLGGLAGGALGMLALSRFGRAPAVYDRTSVIGVLGLVAVGALSIVLSYWKVRGLA